MKIEGNMSIKGISPLSEQNYIGGRQSKLGERKVADAAIGKEQQNDQIPGVEKLINAIEKSNPDVQWYNTSLKFSIHESTGVILVKIIDNETQEVVREIPSEKILNMVGEMLEKTGLFVDKRA